MSAADPRRALPAEERIADSLADLADTLSALRELIDGQLAKEAAEQAESAERARRREPAEWEAALRELRRVVGEALEEDLPQGLGQQPDPERQRLADQVVAGIDRDLERRWGLRYQLRTLAGEPPDRRLEEEARAFVRDQHGEQPAAVGEAIVAAYVKGATRDG